MALFGRKRLEGRYGRRQDGGFGRQVLRGTIRLLIIGTLLTLTWYVTRLPMFTLREVSISGGETIPHEVVRARVLTELTGAYFLIVPKRFSYLYPHDRITEVVGNIPRVHSVEVGRNSETELHVSFSEYVPYALWCAGEADVPCWFMDENGYAFAEAPRLTGGTLVRHTVEGSVELNEGLAIDTEKLRALERFVERAETELGLRITALAHKKNGDIELFINGGGAIFISGTKDIEATFENLRTVLAAPEFEHLEPGNFRYIDVRFDNKVFVNEELETEAIATTTATSTLPE